MRGRLYMIHAKRGDDACPACGQYVIWRKIGEKQYVPCDKEPVMCYQPAGGKMRVVKRGKLLGNVEKVDKSNCRDAAGKKWFYALEPHVLTCPGIPHRRDEHA